MDSRFALSRSEDDKVLAQAKLDALRVCEIETAGMCSCLLLFPATSLILHSLSASHLDLGHRAAFSACAEGRTVTVAVFCRKEFKAMQACMATQ